MVSRSDFPSDDDGEVLYRLASKGIDLTQKRKIEFSCYAATRENADSIVNDLNTYGYTTSIYIDDEADGLRNISVYAALVMLPEHKLLVIEQDRLNAILKYHGTQCDGWVTES